VPDTLVPFVPTAGTVLVVAPLALVAAYACGWLAGRLRVAGAAVPYTRKLFHFAIFTLAGVVQIVWDAPGVIVFGSMVTLVVLYAVWRGEGHALYDALARPSDAPRQKLLILAPLATTVLGGLAANLLFGRLAFIGYLVAGWGDAAGEPVGTRWGRRRYRVPSLRGVPATRSLEGSLAVLGTGSLAAFIGFVVEGLDPAGAALLAGMVAGAAGAAIEATSPHGLDNLTVQIAASGAAWMMVRGFAIG
jgi:phytol kinase